jgi:monothiol glutaredoxin
MNSELVGGADIILQMHQNGEIIAELEKIGHKSVLLEAQQSKDT